jgi:hypothetical protein
MIEGIILALLITVFPFLGGYLEGWLLWKMTN